MKQSITLWPEWAKELVSLYESGAANQFILHGNVSDRFLLPVEGPSRLGDLTDFLLNVLLPGFDVVFGYDLGNGLRVEKGGDLLVDWPRIKDTPTLPRQPLSSAEVVTHYFRYVANMALLKGPPIQVAAIIHDSHLVAPAFNGGVSYELGALASLVRGWTTEESLLAHPLASFLITENLSDLHSLLARNPRAARIEIPLPRKEDLGEALTSWVEIRPRALRKETVASAAGALNGATLRSVENLIKTKDHAGTALSDKDLSDLKKTLVEKDSEGLIEFLAPRRTLDDVHGLDQVKEWLRQDLTLWKQGELQALPKGYLICGPVGTGKTFLVECLAGEAQVPMIKLKNFRDKWVGSSEGNLEKIFRIIKALGRCYVFIDEADQVLGKRDSGHGDSGLSGRLYSMIAEEMGKNDNRGKVIWILASSRPDLIEVDLKRPGRVDIKIPLFPTTTAEESFGLLRALFARRGLTIPEDVFQDLKPHVPIFLTPGTAETLAVKAYRMVKTENRTPVDALKECVTRFQNPVPRAVLDFQIRLAIDESSDRSFIPPSLVSDDRVHPVK